MSYQKRRVKLSEILVKAGYEPFKVLEAIKYPRCIGMAMEFIATEEAVYDNRPDDDFAIRYKQKRLWRESEPTFGGSDLQRNVGMYDSGYYTYQEKKKHGECALQSGETRINVYTFDGYASAWYSLPWVMIFIFSDMTTVKKKGGSYRSGTSSQPLPSPLPPTYFTSKPTFTDYYENGSIIVPAPELWGLPQFLADLAN